jgi:hypothetical protein
MRTVDPQGGDRRGSGLRCKATRIQLDTRVYNSVSCGPSVEEDTAERLTTFGMMERSETG